MNGRTNFLPLCNKDYAVGPLTDPGVQVCRTVQSEGAPGRRTFYVEVTQGSLGGWWSCLCYHGEHYDLKAPVPAKGRFAEIERKCSSSKEIH